MEMADYWLNEKQLVHKLFKVLVPRYQSSSSSFTRLILAPNANPGHHAGTAVLELKGIEFKLIIDFTISFNSSSLGNPFPSLQPETHNHHYWLHNVLLEEAKREFRSSRGEQKPKEPSVAES